MKHVSPGTGNVTQSPHTEWEKKISRIVGRKILVLLCYNDHLRTETGRVLIYLPDDQMEVEDMAGGPSWAEVLAVGDACTEFCQDDVGKKILTPRRAHGIHDLGGHYLMIDEKCLERIESAETREKAMGTSKYRVQPFVVEET